MLVMPWRSSFSFTAPDSRAGALADSYIQEPWYKNPAEYRAFAEKCYVDVKPLLTKAGLAEA